MGNKQILDISTSSIIRVFIVLLVIAFLFTIWQILASIFLAIVIASGMEPAVRAFSKIKVPRLVSAVIIYAIALALITAVFYTVFPTLVSETRQLSLDVPERYGTVISDIEEFFGKTPVEIDIKQQIGGFFGGVQEGISAGAPNIFAFLSNLFGGLLSFALVVVISFYLVFQKRGIENLLKSVIPNKHQEYSMDLWKRVQVRLGKWVQGQLLLAIFVGTLMFIALWLMGVKYALTIALMIGVLEIVPVIGPVVAGLIAFTLISFQSPMLALAAIAIYLVIEQIQQHIFIPSVLSRTVGLNPVVIIVALLVGVKLMGFWGIILAIPVAVTIYEFVKDLRSESA